MAELPDALRARIEERMGRRGVNLSNMKLTNAGTVFVAEMLRGNTIVETLWLRIGTVGARALGESLAEDNATLKTLTLHGNNVGDDGADSMAQMLRKNTALEALYLRCCGVGARGARALGEALKENTSLTSLSLDDNDIGNDGAEALAEALRGNESLKIFYLKRCHLTDVGALSLLSALRSSNSTLKYLHLHGNNGIKYATIKDSIEELLRKNRDLMPASAERRARCLLFCCLQLAPSAHEHVVPSIGAVPVPVMQYAVEHAGELHVAKRFEVGDLVAGQSSSGVRYRSTWGSTEDSSDVYSAAARRHRINTSYLNISLFFHVLELRSHLSVCALHYSSIHLRTCFSVGRFRERRRLKMSADGAVAGELSEALRAQIEEQMGKRSADYFFVRLGDAGAVFVAEKLRGNTNVEDLRLYNCGVGAVGARALAESLAEDNATLKKLYLTSNEVGDDGAESMAQMLRKNKTLELLLLGACGVGARGARALGEALKQNTTLKYLHLDGNEIGDGGAETLAEALRRNESFKVLSLRRCQLTDAGASSLLSALRESNSTLTELDLYNNGGIKNHTIKDEIQDLLDENKAVQPASAERRARCLLFCCLQLAPKAHEHVVPSIGAVPVPVMQYAVEHAGKLHVAKRFEVGEVVAGQSSAGVRDLSTLPSLQSASARRRR